MALAMAVYGLEVPPGDMAISARPDIPSAFRITMAAIDPNEEGADVGPSTLKILRLPLDDEDMDSDEEESDEDFDPEEMEAMLADEDEEEDSESDAEVNGGPSDLTKSKKARKAAALAQIKGLLAEEGVDADDDDEDDEEDDEEAEIEEFVICTLDTSKQYQQTLDLTIGDDERVWFKVTGGHTIYLTGNYIEPATYDSDEDSELDYDLEPEEEDELDGLDDISDRVVELEDEPEPVDKGKKRAVEEDLDGMIAKDTKKQKKQKKNDGSAVEVNGNGKKVAFAKNIEQGPTPSEPPAAKPSKHISIKTVQGVTLDDRKLGSGPVAKKGDRVSLRYIGKLKDGKVFDANKKGKPFSFKLGAGEVVKGMDVGVLGMNVGQERRLIIPAALGYGSKGMPGIPANSQLTFDIKILEISRK